MPFPRGIRPKAPDTPVPTALSSAELPTRRSRRALRAQTTGEATATAVEAVSAQDVAGTSLESVPTTTSAVPTAIPTAPAPLSRRQRRAAMQATEPQAAAGQVEHPRPAEPAAATTTAATLAEPPAAHHAEPADERPEPARAERHPTEQPAADRSEEPASQADEPASQADEPAAEREDPFVEAMRAFGVTGETPVAAAGETRTRSASEHVARGRAAAKPGRTRRIVTTTTASLGVMGVVGLLAVGLTTPVGALAAPSAASNPAALAPASTDGSAAATKEEPTEIQAFVAPSDASTPELEKTSGYEMTTYAEIAAAEGINTAGAAFVNDPTADIQWPFAVGVSISSMYGSRWGRLHEGVDFTPGNGAPIQAIADGTVRIATEAGGAYGVNVYIDHVIDGQLVTSHYAHMQHGSLRVTQGQQVKVGDVIGLVGNTGRSYGAHLHFEIIVGGSTIDPLPWLHQWAGTHYEKEPDLQTASEPAGAGE